MIRDTQAMLITQAEAANTIHPPPGAGGMLWEPSLLSHYCSPRASRSGRRPKLPGERTSAPGCSEVEHSNGPHTYSLFTAIPARELSTYLDHRVRGGQSPQAHPLVPRVCNMHELLQHAWATWTWCERRHLS